MGNHEYCNGCGQSDYHRGRTCEEAYPKEFKEHQRQKRRHERQAKKENAALGRLRTLIQKAFAVHVERWDDKLIIRPIHAFNAEQKRKKAAAAIDKAYTR
jgi:hypothetical protein